MPWYKRLLARLIGAFFSLTALFAPSWSGRQLIRLFATPPRPRIRPKEQAFLDTALLDRSTLREEGGVVYHWGQGSGPYVLTSYGWGYNAGRWRHYIPQLLEAGYRVIAYDPPGHGHADKGMVTVPSNAALIRKLIKTFGRPELILTHSFGGGSTVEALSALPPDLHPKRMVIMASWSRAPWVFRHYQYLLGFSETAYGAMLLELQRQFGLHLGTFDLARKSAGLSQIQGLIVHDPEDQVTHFRNSQRYHQYWPGSYLLEAPRTGHHLGTPELTQTILDFLLNGSIPLPAKRQNTPLPAGHDLVRYFAGMEIQAVERPFIVP